MKDNRTCIICRKSYHYCPVCNSNDKNKPSWYFIFDSENCHDIYDVCTEYRDDEISLDEAKENLSALDLSDLKNFTTETRIQIETIMGLPVEDSFAVKTENDNHKVEAVLDEIVDNKDEENSDIKASIDENVTENSSKFSVTEEKVANVSNYKNTKNNKVKYFNKKK